MSLSVFILVSVIKIVVALGILLTAVAYTVWLERKVVGHIQNRWGPTRVGPFGLLQPLADGVKFIFKEDLLPPHVYKPLYIAAPMIAPAQIGSSRDDRHFWEHRLDLFVFLRFRLIRSDRGLCLENGARFRFKSRPDNFFGFQNRLGLNC